MKKLRVLFVGNSHTYFNDSPVVFKTLVEAGQDAEVEVSMQAHPGVTYGWHLSQGAELRFALMHGNYDYVLLQQAAHSPCPSPEETIADGIKLVDLVKRCGSTPILVMPWAEKRFPEHQAIMYNTYTTLAKECGVQFSPVGYVFERVLNERPDINLYWFDGEHCSPYGTYVNACCAYSMIFGESPVGLPAKSIKHNRGEAEDMIPVKELFAKIAANPNDKELLAKAKNIFEEKFPAIWDKEELYVNLDPEKAEALQKMVWDAVQACK